MYVDVVVVVVVVVSCRVNDPFALLSGSETYLLEDSFSFSLFFFCWHYYSFGQQYDYNFT